MREKISSLKYKIDNVNDRDKLQFAENFALIIYMLHLFITYVASTVAYLSWGFPFSDIVGVLLTLCLIVKYSISKPKSNSEMLLIFAVVIIFVIAKGYNGYGVLYNVPILALLLKDIDMDKICRVFFVTILSLLAITITLALTDVIANLTFAVNWRRARMSFGVGYPTDFAAYFVYLALAWVYIRKEKLTYIELAIFSVVGLLLWKYCDARNSVICLFGITIVFIFVKLFEMSAKKKNREKVFPDWLLKLGTLATPAFAVLAVALSYLYRPENALLQKINLILSGRLQFARQAISKYGASLWGGYIPMRGNGGSTLTSKLGSQYFYLDSSFVRILLCYGKIIFFLTLIIVWMVTAKAAKKRDYRLILIFAFIGLHCFFEQHLYDINYNPFLFVVLANMACDKSPNITEAKEA